MKLLSGMFVALALLILAGFALGPQASSVVANEAGCPFHGAETQAVSTPTAAAQKDGDEDGDSLHESMEDMNDLYRQVRRSARDETKNEETADKLAQIITLVIQGKNYPPPMIAEAPAGQRDELMQTYRLTMIELAQAFLSAEAAIIEGRNDDAWEHLLAANEIKGRGHELFLPEDED